ncbi:MAG: hypothetical protein RSF39_10290 [Romboutsia sp.]
MSNEIKAVSFRLVEEDIQKFREIADQQGLNQAEMFQGLINSFEMAKAKGQITDRAKEIEVFQDTVNNLVSMFINSLAINQTSEERIRETLSLELNTKDKTIADLQEYKEKMKSAAKVNDEKTSELELLVKELRVSLEKTTKQLDQKTIIVDNQQNQINTLNAIVTEYKQYRDLNKELEITNNELNTKITDVLHCNANLEDKIINIESMKEFYKNEVDSLKVEIKDLNTNIKQIDKSNKEDIKAIDKSYKEEVKAIDKIHKDDLKAIDMAHKDELKALTMECKVEVSKAKEELVKRFKEELDNKLENEKSKYQLELEGVINKEKLIQEKYNALKVKLENIKPINNKKN